MNHLKITREMLLSLAISFAAGLLFVNIYNSVVDAPNWGHNLPQSIGAARSYFSASDPGRFFRVASPMNEVISLLCLILCWKASPRVRLYCALALAIAIGMDVFTFGYFYPRNEIMFRGSVNESLDAIRAAHAQWSAMNWVRSAGVALNLAMDFAALYALIGVSRQPQARAATAAALTVVAS